MAGKSKIEWTDATWNPIVGCSIVSPGCTNCYAMKMAARIERMRPSERRGEVILPHHYTALTEPSKAGPVWTGRVNIAPEHILTQPLRWKRGRKIFVNSMGDLFHENIPDEWIDRVFAVMALCPQHTFQVLTKRGERMRAYLNDGDAVSRIYLIACRVGGFHSMAVAWPLPNVWLGVSTERQKEADERIPLLLQTPAAVRFISAEPLLGPISLRWAKWDDWKDASGKRRPSVHHLDGARMLDWVIIGGESGHDARPMHPHWARDLRDQCAEAGVPFFFKQWGQWITQGQVCDTRGIVPGRETLHRWPDGTYSTRLSKSQAGCLLDGREHNEFPSVARAKAA